MAATRTITEREIAAMLDHALLRPDMTVAEVEAGCASAREFDIKSVCVRPCDVARCVKLLAGSNVLVGTVIGFPHGTTSTRTKVVESETALADGARELDMVLNIGLLKSGELETVKADIAAVVAVGHAHSAIVKVIFETALLTDEEKRSACRLSEEAGADFVKTSTGFASGGSTPADLQLMRAATSPSVAVKASGGIRSLDAVLEAVGCGATRIGTGSSFKILQEARARDPTNTGIPVPSISTGCACKSGGGSCCGGSGSGCAGCPGKAGGACCRGAAASTSATSATATTTASAAPGSNY